MLLSFVIVYLACSGRDRALYTATRVHNTRTLPWLASLPSAGGNGDGFATWFGAETVLGISATFVKDGLRRSSPILSDRVSA